jgi:predicted DNA-binding transcriptional regulator AlpA
MTMTSSKNSDDGDALLFPARRVANRLGISLRTLDRRSRDARLGFPAPIKLKERNYFRAADIDAWIETMARRGVARAQGDAK